MSRYYILDARNKPRPCADVLEWARWFEDINHRVIARDDVGEQLVSTVFLGLDHSFTEEGPPILYETMILGGAHDGYQTRCATRAEALRMHARALALAKGERSEEPSTSVPPEGYLQVGVSADGREVVVNHPDLKPDAEGVGHIVFSPAQARELAALLLRHADRCQP